MSGGRWTGQRERDREKWGREREKWEKEREKSGGEKVEVRRRKKNKEKKLK